MGIAESAGPAEVCVGGCVLAASCRGTQRSDGPRWCMQLLACWSAAYWKQQIVRWVSQRGKGRFRGKTEPLPRWEDCPPARLKPGVTW